MFHTMRVAMVVVVQGENAGTFSVRVVPRGRRSAVVGVDAAGALRVRVAAPPVDGAANEELVRFLARDVLHVAPSAVSVVRGHTGRTKVVAVHGWTAEAVAEALKRAL